MTGDGRGGLAIKPKIDAETTNSGPSLLAGYRRIPAVSRKLEKVS